MVPSFFRIIETQLERVALAAQERPQLDDDDVADSNNQATSPLTQCVTETRQRISLLRIFAGNVWLSSGTRYPMKRYVIALPVAAGSLVLGLVACSSNNSSPSSTDGGNDGSTTSSSSSSGAGSSSSGSSSGGPASDGGDAGTVSFSTDIYALFKTECVGCHSNGIKFGADAATAPTAGLDLSGGGFFSGGLDGGSANASWNNIVNKPAPAGTPCAAVDDGGLLLIVPNDAGASLLCNKVTSKTNDVLPLCGNPMPFSAPFLSTLDGGQLDSGAYSGTVLTADQLATLRAWINEGAPNN